MKYVLLALVLVFILMPVGVSKSQQSHPDSIYVTCSGDSELPYIASPSKIEAPMSDYSDIDLRGYCIVDIMDDLKENLRQNGIRLIVSAPPAARPPTATIYFGLDIHGTPLAQLENLTPDQFASAPFLYPHPSDGFGLWATSARTRQEDATLFSGILLYSLGRCDLALPYFVEALKNVGAYPRSDDEGYESTPPIFAIVAFYEANCAAYNGDFKTAETLYRDRVLPSGIFYKPNSAVNLAWVYFQEGKLQNAFQLITKQIDIARSGYYHDTEILPFLLSKRSQLYALAFRYDDAIADMDAAIALEPNDPALYVERGQRIILTYEWDRALTDYNHALELDPSDADAYYYRGILYASVPEGIDARRAALADFQRYLDLAPDGQHAADATRYLTDLQDQLAALGAG